jgi:hypothetical protein
MKPSPPTGKSNAPLQPPLSLSVKTYCIRGHLKAWAFTAAAIFLVSGSLNSDQREWLASLYRHHGTFGLPNWLYYGYPGRFVIMDYETILANSHFVLDGHAFGIIWDMASIHLLGSMILGALLCGASFLRRRRRLVEPVGR